jgi:hypothetical protein
MCSVDIPPNNTAIDSHFSRVRRWLISRFVYRIEDL